MASKGTAVVIQIIPRQGADAHKLLRQKVRYGAATWFWSNKGKTRLRHINSTGHIDVDGADGILVARVFPKAPSDQYFLVEKFIGRVVAWFESELVAVNVQFVDALPKGPRSRS